jgi:hypothetical protein
MWSLCIFNVYITNFDAPDAHFDKLYLFTDAQAKSMEIRNIVEAEKS